MAVSLSFENRKVLVTGAARGLGRDIVKALYEQNAIVYALARNPENLKKLKEDYPNVHTVQADLTNWDETRAAVEKIGPVDYLVNNAGIAQVGGFFSITSEDFDNMMATNVKSVINVSQAVVKGMIESGKKGAVVNVSSLAGKLYSKNISLYCTSKAALDMWYLAQFDFFDLYKLTKNMAVELGPKQIRVNSVNPSIFYTDMTKHYLDKFPDGGDDYQQRVALKKILETREIVNTILFLLSDAAQMINGHITLMDGGFSCQ